MNQNIRNSAFQPSNENKNFLYSLGYQYGNNECLYNFIIYNLNSIPDKSIKKLKVYEWINSIKWLIHRYVNYDHWDFHSSFCSLHFKEQLVEYDFESLYKVLDFLENLQDYQDLQLVGEKSLEIIA